MDGSSLTAESQNDPRDFCSIDEEACPVFTAGDSGVRSSILLRAVSPRAARDPLPEADS
jgi:hypothetical protein